MYDAGADAGQYLNVGAGDGGLSENGAGAGLGAGFRPLLNMYHTKLNSTHGFKWCPSVPVPGAGAGTVAAQL